ncbi:MAG: AAA family ATPase [Elusimicrobiota bacterium]|jgi:hypothetical protein|nr:AAA family ATPase [Elusimicrobiota bacterium]
MKKLALGVNSFEEIRDERNNFIYVDKTQRILDLVSGSRIFVLSRPPRFGKTLLISTLENLFTGKKELFEGLYIYDKWDWEKTYPVIRIDFSDAQITNVESLENFLSNELSNIGQKLGITLDREDHAGGKFYELIRTLSKTTNRQVVVLVDECDKAMRNNFKNPKELEEVQKYLGNFFEILKGADAHIHFVLIMNVLKIIFAGIFSGFNNYTDITMREKSSDLCGYTQEELQTYFKDYIDALAQKHSWTKEKTLEAIKFWYGGYSWDGEISLYHPYSTLKLFSENSFSNYWFDAVKFNFLADMLNARGYYHNFTFGKIDCDDSFYKMGERLISRFFQTGYLGVVSVRREEDDFFWFYVLEWPNEEIKLSFARQILESIPDGKEKLIPLLVNLKDQIAKSLDTLNAAAMEEYLPSIYACIAQNIIEPRKCNYIEDKVKEKGRNCEAFFIYALKFLGFDIFGESWDFGKIQNTVIEGQKQTIIVKIKYDREGGNLDKKVNAVLKEMKDQKYWENHICPDKKIVLLGVVLTDECKIAKGKFEEMK